MLGSLLLAGSRVPVVRRTVSGVPLTRKVVDRFVAGETVQDAVNAVHRLTDAGLAVTIDQMWISATGTSFAYSWRMSILLKLA